LFLQDVIAKNKVIMMINIFFIFEIILAI
jgi:hypothetical protein